MRLFLSFSPVFSLFSSFLISGYCVHVGFYFCNGLNNPITLKQCLDYQQHKPVGFRVFKDVHLCPGEEVYISQDFQHYESVPYGVPEEEIMRLHVFIGSEKIGSLRLLRSYRPDPYFKTIQEEMNLKFRFRPKPVRCGRCNTLEVIYRK